MSILKRQRIVELQFEVTQCHSTFNVLRFELRNCFPNSRGSGFFATCDFCYKTSLECIYPTSGVFKGLKYFSWEALWDGTDLRFQYWAEIVSVLLSGKRKTNSLFFFILLLFLLEIQWEYEVVAKIVHWGPLYLCLISGAINITEKHRTEGWAQCHLEHWSSRMRAAKCVVMKWEQKIKKLSR